MRLGTLRLIHFAKSEGALKPAPHLTADLNGAFYLDSCQRMIWVDFGQSEISAPRSEGFETFFGEEAYGFLVRVACGLESQVIGETDIFGQLKEAWKKFGTSELRMLLTPWIQRLFEDTKELRTHYLQNLGGSSYGSLVRKLLRERSPRSGASILIGAGQLAESIAPYLLQDILNPEINQELLISNRDPAHAFELVAKILVQNPSAWVRVLESPEAELQAMKTAARVILAIPVEVPPSGLDARRIDYLKDHSEIHVLHLGTRSGESKQWEALGSFDCLDSIFEIEKSQSRIRSLQITKARAACLERAKLRELGGAFLAHGWEDLAVFA
jgi:hypothetical protein